MSEVVNLGQVRPSVPDLIPTCITFVWSLRMFQVFDKLDLNLTRYLIEFGNRITSTYNITRRISWNFALSRGFPRALLRNFTAFKHFRKMYRNQKLPGLCNELGKPYEIILFIFGGNFRIWRLIELNQRFKLRKTLIPNRKSIWKCKNGPFGQNAQSKDARPL